MSTSQSFAFRYVSELLGRRLVDAEGRTIGRVQDLVASTAERFPVVRGFVIKLADGERRFLPVKGADLRRRKGRGPLRIDDPRLEPLQLESNEFLIRTLLLDKQIVDVQGAKVERVNDVHLLVTDRARIVHVDVGFQGFLRRLGVEGEVRRLAHALRVPLKEQLIGWQYVQPLGVQQEPGKPIRLTVRLAEMGRLHPGELADILEDLSKDERNSIVRSLGPEAVADVLEEAEEDVQAAVISQLEPSVAADILEEMDPGEAADILTSLPEAHSEEIIAEVEPDERAQLEQLIEYEEKTAAALMTPEFVAIAPEATAREALEEVRRLAPEIESIYYAYVLDGQRKLMGVTTLRSLLVAAPERPVEEIMETRLVSVRPEADLREVAEVFQKYSFLGCPVLDADGRMMGVVLIKHAVDDLLPCFRREARG